MKKTVRLVVSLTHTHTHSDTHHMASQRKPVNGLFFCPVGPSKRVFMPASDASNFFKRRGRRSPKSHAEYFAEQRVQLAQAERRREYYEEQSNEYENHVEESRDEQHERTRETMDQWRQYHYDGQYPRYPHHRPYY
uniref:Unique cartilage matrix-associated protein n=1 Tax=Astyanax mexicanus TaxID=7994 RepID=A0A8B9GRD8_ASTMX